jgi:hypothetical protein
MRSLRKDIITNQLSADIAGGTLGLVSGFVPGAPDGSDLPESVQRSYMMMHFASANATAIVGHVETLQTMSALRPPPGPPSAPAPVLAIPASVAVSEVAVPSVPLTVMAANSSGGTGTKPTPTSGKEWKEKWDREEEKGKEFREKELGPGSVDREVEVWIQKDANTLEKAEGIRFDAANRSARLLEEWTTPTQITETAPGAGKWSQMIRRMSLWQEARANGWRLHGWSQKSRAYVGDITDWQQSTTKYPHWKNPATNTAPPDATSPKPPVKAKR